MDSTEITAGATYTVRIDRSKLSHKRLTDATNLIRDLGRYEDTESSYDAAARAWTVTLPPDSERGLSDLRIAARAYGATVERKPEAVLAAHKAARPSYWQQVDDILTAQAYQDHRDDEYI